MRKFRAGKKPTVQEAIVEILSDEFSLSVVDLKSKMYKRFSINVSYQAVHKEALHLIVQDILKKENGLYSLNAGWVINNLDFFKKIESVFLQRGTIRYVSFDLNDTLTPLAFDSQIWDEEIPRLYSKKNHISVEEAKIKVYAEYYKSQYIEKVHSWMEIEYWFRRLGLDDWKSLLIRLRKQIVLYPEVKENLEWLSKRYKLIIIARSDAKLIELKLEATGIKHYFTHIISTYSSLGLQHKDRVAYEKILDHLKINADQLTHIGDDKSMDYDAPVSAGIRSFLLDRSGRNSGPHIISKIEDLKHHL